jgi:hypothetical protein
VRDEKNTCVERLDAVGLREGAESLAVTPLAHVPMNSFSERMEVRQERFCLPTARAELLD